jgi:hypothetical protein
MLTLSNNLLEENTYIVHATLELFNNIGWADDKLLELIEDGKFMTLQQSVFAYYN